MFVKDLDAQICYHPGVFTVWKNLGLIAVGLVGLTALAAGILAYLHSQGVLNLPGLSSLPLPAVYSLMAAGGGFLIADLIALIVFAVRHRKTKNLMEKYIENDLLQPCHSDLEGIHDKSRVRNNLRFKSSQTTLDKTTETVETIYNLFTLERTESFHNAFEKEVSHFFYCIADISQGSKQLHVFSTKQQQLAYEKKLSVKDYLDSEDVKANSSLPSQPAAARRVLMPPLLLQA